MTKHDSRGGFLLDRSSSVLVVIDVQERYVPHLHEGPRVVEAVRRLIEGAKLVGVPILATEQYPQGLGHTAPAVRQALPADVTPTQKLTMSCLGEPKFVDQLLATGRRQVVVCGIEGHACVNQTANQLLERDFAVHLVIDAISSRYVSDYQIAVDRLLRAGATPTTVESVLLEWVRSAEAPEFQPIRALIRDPLPGTDQKPGT
jgi:nicotinamidase-related amidase